MSEMTLTAGIGQKGGIEMLSNYDKEIAEILGRKRIALISDCDTIYFLFNPEEESVGTDTYPLDNLIYGLVKDEERMKAAKRTKNRIEKEDWSEDVLYDLAHVAFSIGYVLGLSFETEFPLIKEKIENIRKLIRKNHTLPYYPREKKKGGCHEKGRDFTKEFRGDVEKFEKVG